MTRSWKLYTGLSFSRGVRFYLRLPRTRLSHHPFLFPLPLLTSSWTRSHDTLHTGTRRSPDSSYDGRAERKEFICLSGLETSDKSLSGPSAEWSASVVKKFRVKYKKKKRGLNTVYNTILYIYYIILYIYFIYIFYILVFVNKPSSLRICPVIALKHHLWAASDGNTQTKQWEWGNHNCCFRRCQDQWGVTEMCFCTCES